MYNEIYKRIAGIKPIENQLALNSGQAIRSQNVLDIVGALTDLIRVKCKDPLVAACVWLDIHLIPSSESVAGCRFNPLNDDSNPLWHTQHMKRFILRLPSNRVEQNKDGFKLYILDGLKRLLMHCKSTDPAFINLFHEIPARLPQPCLPDGALKEWGGPPGTPEGHGWFNKLPLELRKTIWELLLNDIGPRVIQLYNLRGIIKVYCHPPALFHVNHEARQICTSRLAGYQCFRPTRNFPKDLREIIEIDDNDKEFEKIQEEVVKEVEDGKGVKKEKNAGTVKVVKDTAVVPRRSFPPGNKAAGGIWFNPDRDTLYFGRRSFALAGETLTTGAIRTQMPKLLRAVKHLGIYLMARSLWTVTDQTVFMDDLVRFSAIESVTGVVWDNLLTFEPFTSELDKQLYMDVDYSQYDPKSNPPKKGKPGKFHSYPCYDDKERDKNEQYLQNIRESWDRADNDRVKEWNDNHPADRHIERRTGTIRYIIAQAWAHRPAAPEEENARIKTEEERLVDQTMQLGLYEGNVGIRGGGMIQTPDYSSSPSNSRGTSIERTPGPGYQASAFHFHQAHQHFMHAQIQNKMSQDRIAQLEADLILERKEKEKIKKNAEYEKKKWEADISDEFDKIKNAMEAQKRIEWQKIKEEVDAKRQAERQEDKEEMSKQFQKLLDAVKKSKEL